MSDYQPGDSVSIQMWQRGKIIGRFFEATVIGMVGDKVRVQCGPFKINLQPEYLALLSRKKEEAKL